jgi:hypothetical protein
MRRVTQLLRSIGRSRPLFDEDEQAAEPAVIHAAMSQEQNRVNNG